MRSHIFDTVRILLESIIGHKTLTRSLNLSHAVSGGGANTPTNMSTTQTAVDLCVELNAEI